MDSTASNLNKLNRKTDLHNNYNNLDHLYCHTNESNHIRATNTGNDMGTIRKEIKQLKAMLLLHLDLIQEQSDQLMSKDKLLASLRQENEMLKIKCERMDRRAKVNNNSSISNNKKQQDSQTPSIVAAVVAEPEMAEMKTKCDIDILKKISTKLLNNCSLKLNTLSEMVEDHKYSICGLDDVDLDATTTTTTRTTTITPTGNILNNFETEVLRLDNNASSADHSMVLAAIRDDANTSIIGESNGKLISKIVLQRVQKGDDRQSTTIVIKNEAEPQVPKEILAAESIKCEDTDSVAIDADANRMCSRADTILSSPECAPVQNYAPNDIDGKRESSIPVSNAKCTSVVIPLLSVTHASDVNLLGKDQIAVPSHHDELRKRMRTTTSAALPTTPTRGGVDDEYLFAETAAGSSSIIKRNYARGHKIITTTDRFRTREWCMDEMADEVNRQIAETGEDRPVQENVNLEIPRWVIKECPGLYSIEGTEDLSDEVFLKRHARLEHHERKRKKWDVQRIREQRTIERLKRRHCKDEVNDHKDPNYESSFYPPASNVKYLQYTDELPVVAFGEVIPLLHKTEFSLPWLNQRSAAQSAYASITNSNHNQSPEKGLAGTGGHTAIVFVAKKRINRRHYVSGSSATTASNLTSPTKSRAVIRRRARR